ncbi:hypothetical protein PL2TA16_00300 [Pseudoalteromonas luteoviolacea 2ta16]|uniref:Uncharacterized protein n=1 Tax=Pseudoalteromonas luteoviolacea (strain 2ta16) TaxID=1353533 RepID=V4H236_PSEL2|nr:hypothetical protein PL2TA16_00300 [Pseudoalteromonas luteoviolacea 2ta16]
MVYLAKFLSLCSLVRLPVFNINYVMVVSCLLSKRGCYTASLHIRFKNSVNISFPYKKQ